MRADNAAASERKDMNEEADAQMHDGQDSNGDADSLSADSPTGPDNDDVQRDDTELEPEQGSELQGDEEQQEGPEAELRAAEEREASLKDQLLRLAADFDNFRKRTEREREENKRFAAEGLLSDLLPVVDNLERALAHAGEDDDPVVAGVRMVSRQFVDVLATNGVKPFDSHHCPFDPKLHEAVGQMPTADQPPGTVVQELQKGYLLHDRLHRPARVIVATAPPAATAEPPDARAAGEGQADDEMQDQNARSG